MSDNNVLRTIFMSFRKSARDQMLRSVLCTRLAAAANLVRRSFESCASISG